MGPAAYAVVLLIALLISAQLTMLLDRGRTFPQRLRNLGLTGDAFGLLWIGLLVLGATGALIGSLLNHPGPGASIGSGLALAAWLTAVVLAHRNPPGPGKHTADP
jgi:hypothetical protein